MLPSPDKLLLANRLNRLRRLNRLILLLLLLLAASQNGHSCKSENGDGLHNYLTWFVLIFSGQ